MFFVDKAWLATLATAIGLLAFLPYLKSTLVGEVRPHVLSWVVWGITTTIVFLAQRAAGGGVGAWPVGVSALIAYAIAIAAYTKRADIQITRADWAFFTGALAAVPLWLLTHDPLVAVLVVTTVDVLGFGPTLRKAMRSPQSESALFFALIVVRNVLVLLALESYSMTTALFPMAIGLMALMVLSVVLFSRWRERQSLHPRI